MTVNQNAQPSEATGTVDVQVMGFDGVASETQIAPTAQGVTVDELLARKNGFMIFIISVWKETPLLMKRRLIDVLMRFSAHYTSYPEKSVNISFYRALF